MRNFLLLPLLAGITFAFFADRLQAQDSRDTFETLIIKAELQQSLQGLSPQARALVDSAKVHSKNGDYILAAVFLEQALEENNPADNRQKQTASHGPAQHQPWQVQFQSGIDYNRQEFELGFEQADSVLLDEISKPFAGLLLGYSFAEGLFSLRNNIRYDKENLTNRVSATLNWQQPLWKGSLKAGHLFDRNYTYNRLGYNEIYIDGDMEAGTAQTRLRVDNMLRIKNYKEQSATLPDFWRNTLYSLVSHNLTGGHSLEAGYDYDRIKGLDFDTNNHEENVFSLAHYYLDFSRFQSDARLLHRETDFNYLLGDSLLKNSSRSWQVEPYMKWRLNQKWAVSLAYEGEQKKYRIKTEQDADYVRHYLHPRVTHSWGRPLSLSVGYIYEQRRHEVPAGLDAQYIAEQDYHENGVSLGIDYSSVGGAIVSGEISLSARRYGGSNTQDALSIYADSNIISLLLFAHWPVGRGFSVDAIASFDNDQDKDNDFNDAKSSFFSLELNYSLQ